MCWGGLRCVCPGRPGRLLAPTPQGQPNSAQQPQLGGKVGAAAPQSLSQGDITFKGRGKEKPTLSPYCTGLGVWSSGVSLDRQEPNRVQVCYVPLHGLGNIGSLVHL